jgi:ketosteroid isomerase-like protein
MESIKSIIENLNAAWVNQDYKPLESLLHKDVVFTMPGFKAQVIGLDKCIEGYKQFMQVAELHNFEIDNLNITITGNTAVAHYNYKISYTVNSEKYDEEGIDIFTLTNIEGNWLVVWRGMA